MPFLDQYMPSSVPGYPCVSAPRTRTTVTASAGGGERRNQEWEHPLHKFVLPEAVARKWEIVQALLLHWRIMRGPWRSWPWRDPLDFASRDLDRPNQVPTVSAADQLIGVGDGVTDSFQLVKTYVLGPETYTRPIYLPVLSSLLLAIDGVPVDPADYTVSRPGGVIQFNTAPAAAGGGDLQHITAGFLFDVEVRFESDDAMEAILRAHRAAGFADLTLIEVRPC
jgi:uncharacterized protein (TIGR02217 family)